MLLRFACKNFRSLRDEQEITFLATPARENEQNVFAVPAIKDRVVKSAAIYGANASGKTNVIRALSFFDDVVEQSHKAGAPGTKIPRKPFRLDNDPTKPSYFEADFLLENERFTFGFELNDSEVLREWMYTFPSGRRVTWYERTAGKPINFGRRLTGPNRAIEQLTRKNSLFLSAAAENNHKQLSRVFTWFTRNFDFLNPSYASAQETAELCSEHKPIRDAIVSLLKFADLGIVDFQIKDEQMPDDMKQIFGLMFKRQDGGTSEAKVPETIKKVELIHEGKSGNRYAMDTRDESSGTMAYFGRLGPILQALANGTILLIDELEASLHPSLATRLVEIFNNPEVNCGGAQFIFTTHDASLLNLKILRRDQIWFTEKDKEGATSLYPLSDFGVRNDLNVEKGYLQGRFGAIPFLNERFLKDIERLGCK